MFRLMNVKTLTIWVILILITVLSFGYTIMQSFNTGSDAELVICHWDQGGTEETDLVQKVIDAFEEKYNISVELKVMASYETQFPMLIAAGTVPDVFLVPDGNFGAWVKEKDLMLSLEEYWNNSTQITAEERASIAPSALNRYRYNGKTMGSGDLYCVPKDITPYVMYFNKDLFDEYGVPYPTDVAACVEFVRKQYKDYWGVDSDYYEDYGIDANAIIESGILDPYTALEIWNAFGYYRGTVLSTEEEKIRVNKDKHIYGIAKLYPEGLLWSNNADFLDETRTQSLIHTDEFIQVYEYLVNAQLVYGAAPTAGELGSTTEKSMFLNQAAACYIEGRTATTSLRSNVGDKFDWDCAPVPAFLPNQQCNGWSGSVGYAVSTKTKDPEKAYLLAEFFTSKEGQWIMADAGFTTPLYGDSETMTEFLRREQGLKPANAQEFIRAAQHQRAGLWQYLPLIDWKKEFEAAAGAMFEEEPSERYPVSNFLKAYGDTMIAIIKRDFPELFKETE